MSKVRNFADIHDIEGTSVADISHKHEKMRRAQRRKETANLHARRLKIGQNGHSYHQYEVVDEKPIFTVTKERVPSKEVPERHLVTRTHRYIDKNGVVHEKSTLGWEVTGVRVIPEHTRKIKHYVGTKKVTPYVKRWHINKKWARKLADRKLRNKGNEELYSHGLYKKVFDVMWSVF